MEQGFQYYAFISYKHEDEKWAKWLQRKLENYRLPSVIRKEVPRLPKYIRPIFRDKTDLGAGQLTDSLRNELELSQYLIVICSPEAAKSKWVGKEIDSFVSMGRINNIIPFIIRGEPDSDNPENECFHLVLKERVPEILGINIHEIGKEQAFIKVVAKLMNLRFDALWQRHQRLQRRKRIIATCAVFMILLGLGFVWDYNSVKYEYYADYVDRWGVPEGVVPLKKDAVKGRYYNYRFEYKYKSNFLYLIKTEGILLRVVCVNSFGNPIDFQSTESLNRYPIQEFEYENAKRYLLRIIYKDRLGNVCKYISFPTSDKNTVDIVSQEGVASSTLASISSILSSRTSMKHNVAKSNIGRYQYERNDKGEIIRVYFRLNNDNEPACDANGIYSVSYKLDSLGRPVKLRYLNNEGDTLCDNVGVAGKNYAYDAYGNMSRVEYVNLNGKLTLNEQNWAVLENTSNEIGNIVMYKGYDSDNKPCLSGIYGTHMVKTEFDKHGLVVKSEFYDSDSNLADDVRGYAIVKTIYDKDIPVEQSFFDKNSEPAYSNRGVHRIVDSISDTLYIERYYGIDGEACYIDEGFAEIRMIYSKGMKVKEESYYDTSGNRCCRKNSSISKIVQVYKGDDLTQVEYYDEEDKPANEFEKGIHICRMLYDSKGNIEGEMYYDKNGEQTICSNGYASVKTVRDKNGNTVRQLLYDLNGNLFNGAYPAIIQQKHEKGRVIEEEYFDADNNRMPLPSHGFYKQTMRYDECGNKNIITVFSLDNSGSPVVQQIRYIAHDKRRNEIESYYCDKNGNKLMQEGGIILLRCEWDQFANQTKALFYDSNNKPMTNAEGHAGWVATYNHMKKRTSLTYIDVNGTKCENIHGVASIKTLFDKRGNPISESKYDKRDSLTCGAENYVTLELKYDKKDRLTEIATYDKNHNLVVAPSGYARLERIMNAKNQCVEERYYDSANHLFDTKESFAVALLSFDDYNNVSEITYLDKDRKKTDVPNGYAKVRYNYDVTKFRYDEIKYDESDSLLVISVPIYSVARPSAIYSKGLRKEGIIMKYDDWEIGNPCIDLNTVIRAKKNSPKKIHICTADGEFQEYNMGPGMVGLEITYAPVDYQLCKSLKDDYKAFLKKH
ncbi:toll/interleukin-1 receptor domain-containing protein [Bacteroides sp.]|uniref:toll/interleukin-1 receptor domain-containing protein n=1 Tax=Bacteroides sp. TaxID=29523 RepID=UPI00260B16CD|nr:toll/interleukin-1 receptor domain-containing protein [Bacteroides sp.]